MWCQIVRFIKINHHNASVAGDGFLTDAINNVRKQPFVVWQIQVGFDIPRGIDNIFWDKPNTPTFTEGKDMAEPLPETIFISGVGDSTIFI